MSNQKNRAFPGATAKPSTGGSGSSSSSSTTNGGSGAANAARTLVRGATGAGDAAQSAMLAPRDGKASDPPKTNDKDKSKDKGSKDTGSAASASKTSGGGTVLEDPAALEAWVKANRARLQTEPTKADWTALEQAVHKLVRGNDDPKLFERVSELVVKLGIVSAMAQSSAGTKSDPSQDASLGRTAWKPSHKPEANPAIKAHDSGDHVFNNPYEPFMKGLLLIGAKLPEACAGDLERLKGLTATFELEHRAENVRAYDLGRGVLVDSNSRLNMMITSRIQNLIKDRRAADLAELLRMVELAFGDACIDRAAYDRVAATGGRVRLANAQTHMAVHKKVVEDAIDRLWFSLHATSRMAKGLQATLMTVLPGVGRGEAPKIGQQIRDFDELHGTEGTARVLAEVERGLGDGDADAKKGLATLRRALPQIRRAGANKKPASGASSDGATGSGSDAEKDDVGTTAKEKPTTGGPSASAAAATGTAATGTAAAGTAAAGTAEAATTATPSAATPSAATPSAATASTAAATTAPAAAATTAPTATAPSAPATIDPKPASTAPPASAAANHSATASRPSASAAPQPEPEKKSGDKRDKDGGDKRDEKGIKDKGADAGSSDATKKPAGPSGSGAAAPAAKRAPIVYGAWHNVLQEPGHFHLILEGPESRPLDIDVPGDGGCFFHSIVWSDVLRPSWTELTRANPSPSDDDVRTWFGAQVQRHNPTHGDRVARLKKQLATTLNANRGAYTARVQDLLAGELTRAALMNEEGNAATLAFEGLGSELTAAIKSLVAARYTVDCPFLEYTKAKALALIEGAPGLVDLYAAALQYDPAFWGGDLEMDLLHRATAAAPAKIKVHMPLNVDAANPIPLDVTTAARRNVSKEGGSGSGAGAAASASTSERHAQVDVPKNQWTEMGQQAFDFGVVQGVFEREGWVKGGGVVMEYPAAPEPLDLHATLGHSGRAANKVDKIEFVMRMKQKDDKDFANQLDAAKDHAAREAVIEKMESKRPSSVRWWYDVVVSGKQVRLSFTGNVGHGADAGYKQKQSNENESAYTKFLRGSDPKSLGLIASMVDKLQTALTLRLSKPTPTATRHVRREDKKK